MLCLYCGFAKDNTPRCPYCGSYPDGARLGGAAKRWYQTARKYEGLYRREHKRNALLERRTS